MTKTKFFYVLILALSISTVNAQSVYFTHTDGTNVAYNLSDIQKITFDLDLMKLYLLDGTIFTRNVSTIENFQYSENSVNVENVLNEINDWSFQIFPNPTKDLLSLRYKLPKSEKITISLFDLQGKLILVKEVEKPLGENQDNIDIHHVSPGIYICRISGEKNSISKQFIKQ
jgi:hypothetical protein